MWISLLPSGVSSYADGSPTPHHRPLGVWGGIVPFKKSEINKCANETGQQLPMDRDVVGLCLAHESMLQGFKLASRRISRVAYDLEQKLKNLEDEVLGEGEKEKAKRKRWGETNLSARLERAIVREQRTPSAVRARNKKNRTVGARAALIDRTKKLTQS